MNKRKKILFAGQFAPPVHGVSVMNEYVKNSRLLQRNYEFLPVNLTTARSIGNIGKPGAGKILRFGWIWLTTAWLLLTNRFVAAYVTLSPVGPAFMKDSWVVRLIRWFGIPVILHLHGKGIDRAIARGGNRVRQRYNRVFAATRVVVLAENLKADLQRISDYREVFVVPNGIPPLHLPEKAERNRHRTRVLMLSNLVREKGALDLLCATARLRQSDGPPFEVVLAGARSDAGFFSELEAFVRAHRLEDTVRLAGPVYGEDKTALLASSHIFVLPTYYANECFPLVLLEAMQAALPVIATYEGAIPDMVEQGETGLLVPGRQPEALAAALEKLLRHPDICRQMGKKAAEKYRSHYTLDIFEKNLEAVFNRVTCAE